MLPRQKLGVVQFWDIKKPTETANIQILREKRESVGFLDWKFQQVEIFLFWNALQCAIYGKVYLIFFLNHGWQSTRNDFDVHPQIVRFRVFDIQTNTLFYGKIILSFRIHLPQARQTSRC